jgi:hypothetical protein
MTAPMQSDRSPGWGVPKEHVRAHKRALTVGIAASAALHIVVIVLYSVVMTQWSPRETVLAVDSPSRVSSDMRIVRVVEIAPPDLTAEPPEELPEPEEILLELPDVGLPGPDRVELGEPPGGRRAADVLRVRSSDMRLWREAMPEAFELTEAEFMQLQLAGRLEEWSDSVAIALAAENALTDWTTTDSQGRRWGISPGQLHLGDITLPLPFYFSGNSIQREQAARRAWEDQDILNGTNNQALRSSWRERAEAIRRRQDRNREENDAAVDTIGGSGG